MKPTRSANISWIALFAIACGGKAESDAADPARCVEIGAGKPKIVWQKLLGSANECGRGASVAVDADGRAIVAYRIGDEGDEAGDIFVEKLDVEGKRLWRRSYAGNEGLRDEPYSALATSDGGAIVIGMETMGQVVWGDDIDSERAVVVLRFGPAGERRWRTRLSKLEGRLVRVFAARRTPDTFTILPWQELEQDSPVVRFVEMSDEGKESTRWTYEDPDARSIVPRAVGARGEETFLAGKRYPRGSDDVTWIARFDAARNLDWSDDHGGTVVQPGGLASLPTGEIALFGVDEPKPRTFFRRWLRYYSAMGETLWTAEIPWKGGNGTLQGAALPCDGSAILLGTHDLDKPDAPQDVWLGRYEDGEETWSVDLTASLDRFGAVASEIALSPDGSAYVVGSLAPPDSCNRPWIAKVTFD